MRSYLLTVGLLVCSNIFMTFAWYGHLKGLKTSPWFVAALVSWGIALFEYLLQVPANREGATVMTVGQLKIVQEVIALGLRAVCVLLSGRTRDVELRLGGNVLAWRRILYLSRRGADRALRKRLHKDRPPIAGSIVIRQHRLQHVAMLLVKLPRRLVIGAMGSFDVDARAAV